MENSKTLMQDKYMTVESFDFLSHDGKSRVACFLFKPKRDIRAVIQICHGACEYTLKYEELARELCKRGFLVIGNDHIGHGYTAPSDDLLGYTAPSDGALIMVRDARMLSGIVRLRYPKLPFFLMGHSLGSFVVRRYAEMFGNELRGAVIVGTVGPESSTAMSKLMSKLVIKLRGEMHRSGLLDKMAFGGYNKKFKKEKDKNAWITRDEELRQRYSEDKFCSYKFTARGFYDLFDLLESVSGKDWAKGLPRDLPVLLMSGDKDPVGNYGHGVDKVYKRMVKAGMSDVTVRLYNDARHSLFDETCRAEIIDHTVEWIEMNM